MKATDWSGRECTKTGMRLGAIGPGRCPRAIGTSAGVKLQVCWRFCWFNRCHCPCCCALCGGRVGLDSRRQPSTRSHSSRRSDGHRQGIRMETVDILVFAAARSSSGATADHERSPASPGMARPSLCATCRRDFRAPGQIQDRNPIVKAWARDFYLHDFV